MSFAFRPLMAAAAIALAPPAFAQTATTVPTASAAASTSAREAKGPTEVKVPQAKATAVTNTDTKDTMVKSETKADVKAEAKDSMKKPETTDKGAVMDKVGTVHHKTEKTKDADKPAG